MGGRTRAKPSSTNAALLFCQRRRGKRARRPPQGVLAHVAHRTARGWLSSSSVQGAAGWQYKRHPPHTTLTVTMNSPSTAACPRQPPQQPLLRPPARPMPQAGQLQAWCTHSAPAHWAGRSPGPPVQPQSSQAPDSCPLYTTSPEPICPARTGSKQRVADNHCPRRLPLCRAPAPPPAAPQSPGAPPPPQRLCPQVRPSRGRAPVPRRLIQLVQRRGSSQQGLTSARRPGAPAARRCCPGRPALLPRPPAWLTRRPALRTSPPGSPRFRSGRAARRRRSCPPGRPPRGRPRPW